MDIIRAMSFSFLDNFIPADGLNWVVGGCMIGAYGVE
jgi:hypothetical protein